MKIKTYSLNTAARERLADWVYNNHKVNDAANVTAEVSLEKAKHAAGACVEGCLLCRPCSISHTYAPQWALDTANSHAENFEGCAHVELAPWETYSGHAEVTSFIESDFDITEEEEDNE